MCVLGDFIPLLSPVTVFRFKGAEPVALTSY